jgi:hypothetical protein
MEGFSFVTPVTGLNRPNTGKEDDYEISYQCGHCHTSKLYHLQFWIRFMNDIWDAVAIHFATFSTSLVYSFCHHTIPMQSFGFCKESDSQCEVAQFYPMLTVRVCKYLNSFPFTAILLSQSLLSSRLLSRNVKVKIYKTIILPVVLYGCETWSLTLREVHRLSVFENRVLRKIFGPKRDEVTGEWRKMHNEELHNLYSSPDIIRQVKANEVGGTCGTHGRREIIPLQGLCLYRMTQHGNTQRSTKTNVHASSAIRIHNPSNQVAKTFALRRSATGTGPVCSFF